MPQVLPYSGAMLAIVARSASGRFASPSPKNSTNLSTTPFLRSISVTVSTRSVAVAPGLQLAVQAEADDLRNQHGDRLAEHGGFGFDAADAPAQHAEAVDHGGVRVGADQGVRIGAQLAVDFAVEDDAAQVLEVDLVDDAGVRRNDLEIAERRLAPAQERVALAVARELDRGVRRQRARLAVFVDLHGVVDDELGGSERIDTLRIATQTYDRVAHRREVDDAGHTGEVLQNDARRRERDFVRRCQLQDPRRAARRCQRA